MEGRKEFHEMTQFIEPSKEVKISIEKSNDDLEPMIDKMMLKFSHLAQDIFKNLDNISIAKCRKISKNWRNFIDNQKFQLIRKIQNFEENTRTFNGQWNKVLFAKTSVENIRELHFAVQHFFKFQTLLDLLATVRPQ